MVFYRLHSTDVRQSTTDEPTHLNTILSTSLLSRTIRHPPPLSQTPRPESSLRCRSGASGKPSARGLSCRHLDTLSTPSCSEDKARRQIQCCRCYESHCRGTPLPLVEAPRSVRRIKGGQTSN